MTPEHSTHSIETQIRPEASIPHAPSRRGPHPAVTILAGFVSVALVASLAAVLAMKLSASPSSPAAAAGAVEPGLAAPSQNLLQLSVLHTSTPVIPANFTLTDQRGRQVSLSQFRGKSVLLSFNDDRCPDLCTLLAQAIVMADHDLGAAAKNVVFLSVNVNPFYPQVRYVRSWSDQHGLGPLPNWYFATGSVPHLMSIWKDYGVYVGLDQKTRTVVHGPEIFYISPAGREVAIGDFGTNAASTTLYAHAMAQMAVDLLPSSERSLVAGPPVPAPNATDATVGAPGPSFSVPLLSGSGSFSSADLRDRYAVLNFWSSGCSTCRGEMAHVERAFRAIGKKVVFVGIDVSGHTSAARALASEAGATYPLVADARGKLARAYRVSELPFTIILGPHGTVLVRHPGALTTEQLVYVLENELGSPSGG